MDEMAYRPRPSRSCVYPVTTHIIRDPDTVRGEATTLEFSIHFANMSVKRELKAIIPAINLADTIHIVPTFQFVNTSLAAVTNFTEFEKNRLLENFAGWAKVICQTLIGKGYFADFIDPCTGFPSLHSHASSVYSEVDAAAALLHYRTEQVGFCNLVLHPRWGANCYPASIIANANIEAIIEAVDRANRRWKVQDSDIQIYTSLNDSGLSDSGIERAQSPSGEPSKDVDDSKAGSSESLNDPILVALSSRIVQRVN